MDIDTKPITALDKTLETKNCHALKGVMCKRLKTPVSSFPEVIDWPKYP